MDLALGDFHDGLRLRMIQAAMTDRDYLRAAETAMRRVISISRQEAKFVALAAAFYVYLGPSVAPDKRLHRLIDTVRAVASERSCSAWRSPPEQPCAL